MGHDWIEEALRYRQREAEQRAHRRRYLTVLTRIFRRRTRTLTD